MEICVLILVVTCLQAGFILCVENVPAIRSNGIDEILMRMEEFETRETERENERYLWKQQMNEMRSQLNDVLNENKELKGRITEIEKESEEMKKELRNFKTANHENDENTIRVNQDNELESNIHKILGGFNMSTDSENDIHMVASHGRNARDELDVHKLRRADNELDVAFYVSLSNHLNHAGANQNIAFEHIVTNVGNAYNSHAGDFRAPVSGTYVFSTSLMAISSHTTHYYFAHNGARVGNLYVRGTESPYASSSMTIVLRLNAGDDVAVRNVDADESLHGGDYSSFSGFLLQQDFTVPIVG